MKTWNIPSVEELEVKLTADGGIKSTTEQYGYLQDGWHDSQYDQSIYEKLSEDATCVVKIEECVNGAS